MKVVVSHHVKERLKERLGIQERKIPSFALKVWTKGQEDRAFTKKKRKLGYVNEIYREMMGYYFAFMPKPYGVVLKTIIPKKHEVQGTGETSAVQDNGLGG